MNYKQLGSGIIVPYHYTPKPKRPIAFDFFCGAGGMGCGLIQGGFEIVGANEFDAYASLTYMVNLGHYPMKIHYLDGEEGKKTLDRAVAKCWGLKSKQDYDGEVTPEVLKKAFGDEIWGDKMRFGVAGSGWIKNTDFPGVRNFWFGDMHKLTGKKILDALGLKQGDLDLVAGGPPCQGFSSSGKQQIDDPRNSLVYEYARMIVELQPKTFIMEEVPDIVNFMDPEGIPVLDKFCMLLQDGGYGRWEMLKKSLLMNSGSGAGVKSTGKGVVKKGQFRKKKPTPTPKMPDSPQLSLFGG